MYGYTGKGEEQRELQQAITAVRRTRKAHQFVMLGHIYQQMGERGHALAVYQQALARDPNNIEALRGCSTIEKGGLRKA